MDGNAQLCFLSQLQPPRSSQSWVLSKPKSSHVSFLLFTSQDKSQTLPRGYPGPACPGPFLPLSPLSLALHTPVTPDSLRSSDVVPSASGPLHMLFPLCNLSSSLFLRKILTDVLLPSYTTRAPRAFPHASCHNL